MRLFWSKAQGFLHKKINIKLSTFTTIFLNRFFLLFPRQSNEFLHEKIHFPSIFTSGNPSTTPQNLIKFHHRSQTKTFTCFHLGKGHTYVVVTAKSRLLRLLFFAASEKKETKPNQPIIIFQFPALSERFSHRNHHHYHLSQEIGNFFLYFCESLSVGS